LGIFFTPWLFDGPLIAAGVITALAIVFLWQLFRRGAVDARALVVVSSLYGAFALLVAFYFPR
jgi:cation:H+ antiporter